MPATKTFWWTPAPFLRLLPSLMLGIAAGWYLHWPSQICLALGAGSLIIPILFPFLPVAGQYKLRHFSGASLLLLVFSLGGLLIAQQDIRNKDHWFGNQYKDGQGLIAVLNEEPVEKAQSFKAAADVQYLIYQKKAVPVCGKLVVYFRKNIPRQQLAYGTRILFRKPLHPIRNSGNPGAFDYQRYCLFQGITHQVFLDAPAYRVLSGKGGSRFTRFIIGGRLAVVSILRQYISSAQEQGLAEALLIGYKDNLDKSLVQAYSNTGVVHVIAISGLHLGLIYGLLVLLLRPLRKRAKILRFILIVSGLWAFALLAGAQPSVLRSAVMFSCMALGELMARKSAVFNTLALSAFGLLCFNPFWLWDLGFQLSYAAVGSILLFYQPLYRSVYFPNRAVNQVWQLVALTLTAQVFTLPVSLYHFHQFPALFLLTNLLAVPLSSLILLGEILLCLASFLPPVARLAGHILEVLIRFMNAYILRLDKLSFALWDGFSFSLMQVVLLFAAIGFAAYWMLEEQKKALRLSLFCILLFTGLRSWRLLQADKQRQLIVYNVPKYPAADFIAGRQVFFKGAKALLQEGFERNFHLKPARIALQAKAVAFMPGHLIQAGEQKVLFYDQYLPPSGPRPNILVVSGKGLLPDQWSHATGSMQVVLDATVPPYKSLQWQQWCDSVGWPLHDVKEKGAFVMKW